MRYFASVTVIVLLLLSTTGISGWYLTRPDPTHVTSLNDSGPGSLHQAIAVANPGSTITFDTALHGTILLTRGDLIITKNLTIRGPGAAILSISGGKSGHIVDVLNGATVTISGLAFKGSTSLYSGFILNGGTLTLTNSTVWHNTAQVGSGGGIYNNGGTLTLNNSTVSDNTALNGLGGGIYNNGGTLTLNNSTVWHNTAEGSGGGIENVGTLTLTNSTVSGNTATTEGGGGIDNSGVGTLTLTNSTVSGNTATGGGGGIATVNPAKIGGSIVANNTGGNCSGGVSSQGYNLESGTDCSFTSTGDLQNTNPLLDPSGLQNNGGPTQTIALQQGSPAINHIPVARCPSTDQRGMERPDDSESACDIGAYESS
jgi:hypothetical protein